MSLKKTLFDYLNYARMGCGLPKLEPKKGFPVFKPLRYLAAIGDPFHVLPKRKALKVTIEGVMIYG